MTNVARLHFGSHLLLLHRSQSSLLELDRFLFRLFDLEIELNLIFLELDSRAICDSLQVFVPKWFLRRLIFRIQALVARIKLDQICRPNQQQSSTLRKHLDVLRGKHRIGLLGKDLLRL